MLAATLAGCTGEGAPAPVDPYADDRLAIAKRNDCQGILSVQQVDQDHIQVALNIGRPQDSQEAMDRHPDPTIVWLPPQVAASWLTTSDSGEPRRGRTVPVTSSFAGHIPHEDFNPTATLQPGPDPEPGQRIVVTLYSSAETTDFERRRYHEARVGSYCGTLVAVARDTNDGKGGIVWEVDSSAPPFDDTVTFLDCALVQNPARPSQYSSDC